MDVLTSRRQARAVRNSRGEWCLPVAERGPLGEPVHNQRVLRPLGIPRSCTQMEADKAAGREARRER